MSYKRVNNSKESLTLEEIYYNLGLGRVSEKEVLNMDKYNQRGLILDAAYKCVAAKGYANSSLREIAKEADVTLSQLHYYFGSKQDLFKEVIKFTIDKYISEFRKQLGNSIPENNPMASLTLFLQKMMMDNPELMGVLFDLASLSLRVEKFQELMSDLFDELTTIFEEVFNDSELFAQKIKKVDQKNMARLMLGSFLGMGFQLVLDKDNKSNILQSINLMNTVFD